MTVITAATRAVEVVSAEIGRDLPVTSLALERISGFSTTMYAIVKKVATPPRISRCRVELRRETEKKRSIAGQRARRGSPSGVTSGVEVVAAMLQSAPQIPVGLVPRRGPGGYLHTQ